MCHGHLEQMGEGPESDAVLRAAPDEFCFSPCVVFSAIALLSGVSLLGEGRYQLLQTSAAVRIWRCSVKGGTS